MSQLLLSRWPLALDIIIDMWEEIHVHLVLHFPPMSIMTDGVCYVLLYLGRAVFDSLLLHLTWLVNRWFHGVKSRAPACDYITEEFDVIIYTKRLLNIMNLGIHSCN